jgi:hypothetical protein
MAIPRSEEIKDLAVKYSKQQLAQLAQRGEVDPTTAIMAGMMRDRIVQAEMKPPETTVFQDTFAPPQTAMAPAGLGATPQGQQMAPQMQQAQAPVTAAQGGLMALDVPDDMVPDEYAGGGIIAFSNGGASTRGVIPYDPTTPFNRMFPDPNRRVPMTEEEKEEARRLREMGLFDAIGELTSPVTNRIKNYFSNLSGDLAGRRDLAPAPNPAVIDDYPGINFTDADIAKAMGPTPNAPGQGAPAARPANQPAPKAGPAAQAGPAGIAPEAAPLTIAEMLKQREAEERAFVGENPKIAKMQELLDKQDEDSFLDRALRSLQMITAGEALRTKGDTSGLKEVMTTEGERKKSKTARAEKRAELEGADYERRAGIFKEVAGERREEAKTKADRAFQEKLLNRKLEVQEKIAKMKPESATAELIKLARSKDPVDRQIYKDLTASKSGAMTREDAVKLALQSNPTLAYAGKEAELEETVKRILGTVSTGGYTPTAQQQSILDKYNK